MRKKVGQTVGIMAMIGVGAVGLGGLVIVALFVRAMPRATFVAWSVAMFFTPIWIGVTIGHNLFLSAVTVVTLIALAGLIKELRLAPADIAMAVLVGLVTLQYALSIISLTYAVTTVLEWLIPYAWGRLVLSVIPPRFITSCITSCALIASAMAVTEFATGFNIFSKIKVNNPLYETWGTLLTRVGYLRAEGAWGHPIALGAALAMCVSFAFATSWRPKYQVLSILLIAAGTVLTLSRTGIYTLILAVALSIALLPNVRRATRTATAVIGIIGGLIFAPFIMRIFSDEGQTAQASASYRGNLFSLFSFVKPFGSAQSLDGVTIAGHYIGFYSKSIDNTFLLTGLRLGWFPLGAFCLVIILAILPIFMHQRITPAIIAVAAQIPGLFTVALITQFGMFFWFMVGLAVGWDSESRRGDLTRDDASALASSGTAGAVDSEKAGAARRISDMDRT